MHAICNTKKKIAVRNPHHLYKPTKIHHNLDHFAVSQNSRRSFKIEVCPLNGRASGRVSECGAVLRGFGGGFVFFEVRLLSLQLLMLLTGIH
jgi:hypothetical protein